MHEYEKGRREALQDLQKRQIGLLYAMRGHINAIMTAKGAFLLPEHDILIKESAEYQENRREIQRLTLEIKVIQAMEKSLTPATAHWIRGEYACGEYEFKCSKCEHTEWHTSTPTKFCASCGAPMEKEIEIGEKE